MNPVDDLKSFATLRTIKNVGILFLKLPLNLILLISALVAFKFTGKRFARSGKRFQEVFYILGGAPLDVMSRLLRVRPYSFKGSGVLTKFGPDRLNTAARQLKRDGYVVFENVLEESTCARLLEASLLTEGTFRAMDDGKQTSSRGRFDRRNPQAIRFDYESEELLKIEEVQNLLADKSILQFAQDYLGGVPILDIVTMWWHTAYSSAPDKHAAQWFHFDLDSLKWIKFFFYLTDVNPESGPHIFVPGTHIGAKIPFRLRKKGYTRLTDQEVSAFSDASNWKEFVGSKGTLIVEDTRGLHKGKHVLKGDRLLFQLQFSSSTFGGKIELGRISGEGANSPAFQEICLEYPYIYQNIQK